MAIKTHRLQAFTILEVTITMLVAAIVIGIAYTSFNIVSKSYLNFKAKNEDMAIIARVDQLLKRDFDQAETITNSENDIMFLKQKNISVTYQITPLFIVRKSGIIDTFKVHTENIKMLFEGKIISSHDDGSYPSNNIEKNRVDELSFTLTYNNESIPYRYQKQYSSANLIQRNP